VIKSVSLVTCLAGGRTDIAAIDGDTEGVHVSFGVMHWDRFYISTATSSCVPPSLSWVSKRIDKMRPTSETLME
jgi:hypothetical protein